MSECLISYLIATHNRRSTVVRTIDSLLTQSADGLTYEILVVDNASTDGTSEHLARYGEPVSVIRSARNFGSCGKALAIDRCRGRYVMFLDDDSIPQPGSMARMVAHFEADSRLAAAGFRVILPDGSEECSALGDVFVGCGAGLGRDALQAVGGLDGGLFMQAEEYDLAFRLIGAGWHVRRFEDLAVDHLKSPQSRLQARTAYYDSRNNLLLTYRYLPSPLDVEFRRDWKQRYRWLAVDAGVGLSFIRGAAVARRAGRRQRDRYHPHRLDDSAVESIFRIRSIADRMASLAAQGVERIVLAGMGKNIFGYYRGAVAAGLTIQAVGDDRFAAPRRRYRGVPILPMADALQLAVDAVVVADSSPVGAREILHTSMKIDASPVQCWFWDASAGGPSQLHSTGYVVETDKSQNAPCAPTSV
ncbi:MAG: glycosyltransferase [Planctomycetes bacterium]|nr:glycosyltransferase [Planctomycetota bacterium]